MVMVIVGSTNPVKIEAAKEAFSNYFPELEVQGIEVPSGVAAQPFGDDMFKGAEQRAKAVRSLAQKKNIKADYCIGIEAGVLNLYSRWFTMGCVCILHGNKIGFGTSSLFELPLSIVAQLQQGEELGHLFDAIAGTENIKQKGGAIGYLTKGIMNRKQLQVPAVVMALVPLLNGELYF